MHYGVSDPWTKKNRCLSDLYGNYSPQNWPFLAKLGDLVFTRECPALGALDEMYKTRGAAATWVQTQITAMYVASGSRDSAMTNAITVFSENFATTAAPFKLTEIMLFFSRYVAGMYDDSYSTFNARRIGVAFHKKFLPQRDQALARIERERGNAERNKIPAFAISKKAYEAAKDFVTTIRIIRDSEQLRSELSISEGIGVNGLASSVLPKAEIHRIHDYVKRGDIRIVKCSPIGAISGDLSKENSKDDSSLISG